MPGGGATAGAEAKLCSREIIQAAAKETCNICYSVEHVSTDPWTVDILHSILYLNFVLHETKACGGDST